MVEMQVAEARRHRCPRARSRPRASESSSTWSVLDHAVALAQLRFEEGADAGLEQHGLAVERAGQQRAAGQRRCGCRRPAATTAPTSRAARCRTSRRRRASASCRGWTRVSCVRFYRARVKPTIGSCQSTTVVEKWNMNAPPCLSCACTRITPRLPAPDSQPSPMHRVRAPNLNQLPRQPLIATFCCRPAPTRTSPSAILRHRDVATALFVHRPAEREQRIAVDLDGEAPVGGAGRAIVLDDDAIAAAARTCSGADGRRLRRDCPRHRCHRRAGRPALVHRLEDVAGQRGEGDQEHDDRRQLRRQLRSDHGFSGASPKGISVAGQADQGCATTAARPTGLRGSVPADSAFACLSHCTVCRLPHVPFGGR